MTNMTICLLIFALMIVLFFTRKIPMSMTSMIVMVLLIVTGCIDAKSALATFGSTTVITMVSMYIVAAGLSRTQMISHITKLLYKVTGGSFTVILAAFVGITVLLGQFIPSIVALFVVVSPLVLKMCDEMNISPSKMIFPIAIASVSCSFIIEPIGPYAAWYVTDNGYLESYGWTATQFNMWTETSVIFPVGVVTALLAIFVVPKFLPDTPDLPTKSIESRQMAQKEPLGPVREFLGYGIFIAVIIALMLGVASWQATIIGAIAVVVTGVLTEKEAIDSMNMDTIMLYVGVVVLGNALSTTGAAEMLGDWLASWLMGINNAFIINLAFYCVGFIMTSVLYNRAVTTVLTPLTIMTCVSMGVDPRGPIIMCALASMSSLITPMATAVVPLAMGAGGYSQKTILKAGWLTAVVRGLLGAAVCSLLLPMAF
ncbi:MAG: anion permease [Lachnospiraceae bacterium]|nr:anion permease [Lachnospiraceae bacterium]